MRNTIVTMLTSRFRFFISGFLFRISILLFLPSLLFSQEKTTSFGFVIKPIFPSTYFRTGPQTNNEIDTNSNHYTFKLAQTSGFSAGGILRKGLTKNLSIETGIQYVKRHYNLDVTDSSIGRTESSDFKIIGYEVPLQVLVFVQLSQQIWMNASLGASIDMFPSNIYTQGNYFKHFAYRTSRVTVFNGGVLANIGWEYRTEKSGTVYIGSSYHRSFNNTFRSVVEYYRYNTHDVFPQSNSSFSLKGDYLTLDLRYYFHGDVNKKKKVVKK